MAREVDDGTEHVRVGDDRAWKLDVVLLPVEGESLVVVLTVEHDGREAPLVNGIGKAAFECSPGVLRLPSQHVLGTAFACVDVVARHRRVHGMWIDEHVAGNRPQPGDEHVARSTVCGAGNLIAYVVAELCELQHAKDCGAHAYAQLPWLLPQRSERDPESEGTGEMSGHQH